MRLPDLCKYFRSAHTRNDFLSLSAKYSQYQATPKNSTALYRSHRTALRAIESRMPRGNGRFIAPTRSAANARLFLDANSGNHGGIWFGIDDDIRILSLVFFGDGHGCVVRPVFVLTDYYLLVVCCLFLLGCLVVVLCVRCC